MSSTILPQLLKHSFSIDLNTRHGALLCLGELIHSLCELEQQSKSPQFTYFSDSFVSELKSVIGRIFDEKYFRGSGVEYMRLGVCFFVKKLALSRLFCLDSNHQLGDPQFFKQCELFLSQCLEYNKEIVQLAAVEALPFYCDLKYLQSASDKKTVLYYFIRFFF